MIYNLLCGGFFALTLAISVLIGKTRQKEMVIWIISLAMLVYKITQYLVLNITGTFSVPIEISSISYFLLSIIIVFRLKKLYHVGAFFGMIAGIGYFAFYIFFGFLFNSSFTVMDMIISSVSHGYLLITGLYLFKNNSFEQANKLSVWIVLLAMLCWGLVFYDLAEQGITFVYYIIKPEFLFIFDNMSLNVLILMAYYVALTLAFAMIVRLFFRANDRLVDYKVKKLKILEDEEKSEAKS